MVRPFLRNLNRKVHRTRRHKNNGGSGGTFIGTTRDGGGVVPLLLLQLLSAAAVFSLLGVGWTVQLASSPSGGSVPTTRGAVAEVDGSPQVSMPNTIIDEDGGVEPVERPLPSPGDRGRRGAAAEPQNQGPPPRHPTEVDGTMMNNSTTIKKKKPCESLYMQRGGKKNRFGVEHSPLLFERTDSSTDFHPPLLVCRTPKIGSTELRLIKKAYEKRSNFTTNAIPTLLGRALSSVSDASRFDHLLYSPEVTRITFVRHPVRRILSGFLQVARERQFWTDSYDFWAPLGFSPAAFRLWIFNSTFSKEYDGGTCRDVAMATAFSMDRIKQHFLPAQHCRCGVSDCGVGWQRYRIDGENFTSVGEVLRKYIPGPWIPKPGAPRVNAKRYREGDYLTQDVLGFLNELTRVERGEFGYPPLVVAGTKRKTTRQR